MAKMRANIFHGKNRIRVEEVERPRADVGEAVIRVKIFWRKQLGPGSDTDITWFEPACVDDFAYESQGADIFRDSNDEGIFVKEQHVFRAGDHLVKVQSDSFSDYLLRTEVLTKEQFEQEQKSRAMHATRKGDKLLALAEEVIA